ncbi:MAG: aminopeptidase P family protein [Methanothrix sp.]|nr:aminopeptidase P family protein [Methanothrix sp.]
MSHILACPSAAMPGNVSSPTGGKGISLFFAQGPGFARIEHGEPVLVDYAGCYNGYLAGAKGAKRLTSLPQEIWRV